MMVRQAHHKIVFACFSPHPPLLLPTIGSEEDRAKVRETIKSLEQLEKEFAKVGPDQLLISSPHPDWGFNVPLHFLAKDFKGEIKTYLTESEPPSFHFGKGKKVYRELEEGKEDARSAHYLSRYAQKYALIASGDLSHCLKEDGPYGFHPDGPRFDQQLIESLKKKDLEAFLKLDETFPEAGECGLRSFSFLLGVLEESKIGWKPEILSYEGPFGVGYLVANFKLGLKG